MNDSVPPMLKPFSQEYGTSQSVQDGLLPVHPLVLEVPATLRSSTLIISSMNSRTVRDASADRCVISTTPAAPSSSWATWPQSTRPHDRICARPAAVARNLEINSDSANDPCSAQSWTLGHSRNRGGWTGPPGPGNPDSRLRAQMRQRHTARVQRLYGQNPSH